VSALPASQKRVRHDTDDEQPKSDEPKSTSVKAALRRMQSLALNFESKMKVDHCKGYGLWHEKAGHGLHDGVTFQLTGVRAASALDALETVQMGIAARNPTHLKEQGSALLWLQP